MEKFCETLIFIKSTKLLIEVVEEKKWFDQKVS